jgi:hypothetical protein
MNAGLPTALGSRAAAFHSGGIFIGGIFTPLRISHQFRFSVSSAKKFLQNLEHPQCTRQTDQANFLITFY